MEHSASLRAVRDFLKLVSDGEPPSLDAIALALDRLALAYNDAPPGEDADNQQEPPRQDYALVYANLARRFPDLGYYGVADPLEPAPASETMNGDAVDDLADLVIDLSEISWRADANGLADAHWHLRESFAIHWGWHLRSLALYLHARQFG